MLNPNLNFLIRCHQTGQVWLFNCGEGCQNIIQQKKIKVSQINNIVITNLKIENLAGIMGLLASLSLTNNIYEKSLNMYGPPGLLHYLQFARKYSHTAFKYSLIIHIIEISSILKKFPYFFYFVHSSKWKHNLIPIFLESEKNGRFQSNKALLYGIESGPIYGCLKRHKKYLLPDGSIISGKYFTCSYAIGIKILYLRNTYGFRLTLELLSSFAHVVCK
uniref:Ribonuclease Z n=1 Tax=Nemalion vermiculare TaxID=935621 RepID=UPI0025801D16|nr:Ribonuclease Z [Nemalion vermiculare]WGV34376.1 Ribonuclease Z [Nemalion vermiculare]